MGKRKATLNRDSHPIIEGSPLHRLLQLLAREASIHLSLAPTCHGLEVNNCNDPTGRDVERMKPPSCRDDALSNQSDRADDRSGPHA